MADVTEIGSSGEEADVEDDVQEYDETSCDRDGKKKNMAGMLDVINKILNKKIKDTGQSVILSKYKEGKKRKLEQKKEELAKKAKLESKAEFREKNHVVPDRSNAEKEVALRRIGTKGVVKLFNAVTKHQKEMESKLKKAPTQMKKDKVIGSVSKSSFLDMLKSSSASKAPGLEADSKKKEETEEVEKEKPSWNILRDDFMMGSKMKDWDKNDNDVDDDDEKVAAVDSSEDAEDSE